MRFAPIVIGIAGGSGSGKSTILNSLADSLPKNSVTLFSQDNYYRPIEEQFIDENGMVNFDLPTAINQTQFLQDLLLLKSGKPIEIAEYGFNNRECETQILKISPKKIIVCEGLFIFCNSEIDKQLDLRLYVDVPEKERLRRRIERDGKDRNYPESDVRYRWKHHVRPAELEFLEPFRESADFIIDNTVSYQADLDLAIKRIEKMVSQSSGQDTHG